MHYSCVSENLQKINCSSWVQGEDYVCPSQRSGIIFPGLAVRPKRDNLHLNDGGASLGRL